MPNDEIVVRDEAEADVAVITEVTAAAFAPLEISTQTEHFIIEALRAAGALVTVGVLLWRLLGEVVIEVSGGVMEYRVSLGLFSFGRSYDLRLVRELRGAEADDDSRAVSGALGGLGRGRGRIRFAYGARSVSLRPGLEPSEARNLVDLIDPFVPRGGPSRRYSAAIS